MADPIRILIVEDDFFQIDWMKEELERELAAEIDTVKTEREFKLRSDEIAANPPDIAIIDVMLVGDVPRKGAVETGPEPEEQQPSDLYAGLLIQKALAEDSRTATVPSILYTVLDRIDLPEGTTFLPKGVSIKPLIEDVRQRLGRASKRRRV